MISRHLRVLFWILLLSSVAMSIWLIRLRERAHDRLMATAGTMPLAPPPETAAQDVTLIVANDMDGSLTPMSRQIALPPGLNARTRSILQTLIAGYAEPGSEHPIAANSGVNGVFFMDLPPQNGEPSPGKMAVVDLSGSFVQAHPSGIEPETLTLLSIIGTLHANFPEVAQVRFLVDGQPRETLAGHADLTRVYLASDAPGVKHL